MISNLSSLASPVVFPVELVVPVELQTILPILVELRGGTGGARDEGSAGRTSITETAGPTSSTRRSHMAALNPAQFHRFHQFHRLTPRCPCGNEITLSNS